MGLIMKLQFIILGLSILITCFPINAQAPDTLWTRVFVSPQDDIGWDVEETLAGGMVIVGETKSFGAGDLDIYVILTNEEGDAIWMRAYGGENVDVGRAIVQSDNGDFIIAGYTTRNGYYDTDVCVLKLTDSGQILWTKTYGGNYDDRGMDLQKTNDGGYIITGFTKSFGSGVEDVYLIKIESNGDTMWTKTYGGQQTDIGNSVRQLKSGGYIIGGYSFPSSFTSYFDFYLIKTDANGNKIWERNYGGEASDFGYDVIETFDEQYVMVGETRSSAMGFNDIYIIKVNGEGDTIWTKKYGGDGSDEAYSVIETYDKKVVVAGITNGFGNIEGGVYVLKVNDDGSKLWEKSFRFENFGAVTYSINQTKERKVILTGKTTAGGSGSYWNAFLVMLGEDLNGFTETSDIASTFTLEQNYPNPFNPSTKIQYSVNSTQNVILKVYDLLGREIAILVNEEKPAGEYEVEFNANSHSGEVLNLTSGIYFYQLKVGNYVET